MCAPEPIERALTRVDVQRESIDVGVHPQGAVQASIRLAPSDPAEG